MIYDIKKVDSKITTIGDDYLAKLKHDWFHGTGMHKQLPTTWKEYLPKAQEWFLGSKLVTLHGVDKFPYVDVTCGNTQFIESFVLKHGWHGFQILNSEYAYYGLMGKHGVDLDCLEKINP